jgi:hypothetical protein
MFVILVEVSASSMMMPMSASRIRMLGHNDTRRQYGK